MFYNYILRNYDGLDDLMIPLVSKNLVTHKYKNGFRDITKLTISKKKEVDKTRKKNRLARKQRKGKR